MRAALELARARRRALRLDDLAAVVTPKPARSSEEEFSIAIHECAHTVVGRALGITVPLVSMVVAGKIARSRDL
jgi:hypothetical protein